ncbi:MAG: hypothetical protein ACP5QR_12015 [Rhizomicrobium sp.]
MSDLTVADRGKSWNFHAEGGHKPMRRADALGCSITRELDCDLH